MAYMHIDNLYRNQDILLFKECWALEKVHGTSAHISWKDGQVHFFAGGERHSAFIALFDEQRLKDTFYESVGEQHVTIFGEAYGGKCQGMSGSYGKELRFIAFDVKIGDTWLAVPNAHSFVLTLGLEFVPYCRVPTALEALDAERDRPSAVAYIRGCGPDKEREGVILRPLIEVTKSNGARIIAKHKREKFCERATPQKVVDPDKLVVLAEAKAIAEEWVTEMRLTHILQKFPADVGIERTGDVIKAMIEDVSREAEGEIVLSKDASKAIGSKAAVLFKNRLKSLLYADGPSV